jgi:hypothetical protein
MNEIDRIIIKYHQLNSLLRDMDGVSRDRVQEKIVKLKQKYLKETGKELL